MSRYLGIVVLAVFLISGSAFADDFIYKSPNKIDYIKIGKAKKEEKEGGLKQPYTFGPDQMRVILRSVHFNKKIMMVKSIQNRELFTEQNVEFLAPYLMEAFKKAKADETVIVSYFTRHSNVVIQDDRLTVFRAFVKDDGLHIRFTKLYAKMLGDRTTMGAERAAQEARGLQVSLELQPGQNRIGWNPEEIVFDLNHFTAAGIVNTPDKSATTMEQEKAAKKKKTASAPPADEKKSIRVRLKELDQLKKDEMITEKEYQEKRKELIKEL